MRYSTSIDPPTREAQKVRELFDYDAEASGVRQKGSRFYAYVNTGRGRQRSFGGYASAAEAAAAIARP